MFVAYVGHCKMKYGRSVFVFGPLCIELVTFSSMCSHLFMFSCLLTFGIVPQEINVLLNKL